MKSIVTALVDPSGAADYGPDAYVEIWSQLPVGAGGTIATDKPLRVSVTASGLSTDPIRPGNYLIRMKLSTNRTALGPYPFTMPDGDGTTELWPLIQAAIGIPADTPFQQIQEAVGAYIAANPIDGEGLDQTAVDARVETVGDTRYAPLAAVATTNTWDATTGSIATITEHFPEPLGDRVWTYGGYNAVGDPTTLLDPDGQSWLISYDAAGNQSAMTEVA